MAYCYMCSAFAYIPHSLFWMDYLSGTLHFPLQQRNLFLGSLWSRKLCWRLCGVLFKPPYWIFARQLNVYTVSIA